MDTIPITPYRTGKVLKVSSFQKADRFHIAALCGSLLLRLRIAGVSEKPQEPSFLLKRMIYETIALAQSPDDQVAQTIAHMSYLAIEDSRNPIIVDLSKQLAQETFLRDGVINPSGLAVTLFSEIKKKLEFTLDSAVKLRYANAVLKSKGQRTLGEEPDVVEILIRPVDVELIYSSYPGRVIGDCDDHAMFAASIVNAWINQGFDISNPGFVTVSAEPGITDYSHVYFKADFGGKSLTIDGSHGDFAGWEIPKESYTDSFWNLFNR